MLCPVMEPRLDVQLSSGFVDSQRQEMEGQDAELRRLNLQLGFTRSLRDKLR